MKTVIVFGKSSLATHLSEWILNTKDFKLLAAVPCNPTPDWCEDLGVWAEKHGVPFIESGSPSDLDSLEADIAISCYYDQIFQKKDISRFRLLLNIHNSALPKHRGVGPIEWSRRDGSGVQGITVHAIDNGIDTGEIYGQLSFRLWDHLGSNDIHSMCMDFGLILIKHTLLNLDKITPYPQDDSVASYHSKLDTHKMMTSNNFNAEIQKK